MRSVCRFSVRCSVLATRVTTLSADGFAKLGIDTHSPGSGGNLDLNALPGPIADIIRGAYGDATGLLFLIAAAVALITLVCVIFIPNTPLRRTIDIQKPADAEVAAETAEIRA